MEDKHAILLVRVSTLTQDYSAQIADLKEYAISKGYNKFHVIDTKESGLVEIEDKLGTNEMFTFHEKHPKYKTVFITEMSRLGRRQSVLHHIKEWFIKNTIQLYVKDNDYQLYKKGKVTFEGELMFSLYSMFAEAEIKQKKDRFLRKRRELMEQGYSIGGKVLFGYERVKADNNRNTLKINDKNASYVRTIFNWYLHGIDDNIPDPSIKVIAIECMKRGYPSYTHSKRNVNKLLKEEGYTGFKTTNNKRKNPLYEKNPNEPKYLVSNYNIKYPIIIERSLFDAVQEKLKTNVSKATRDSVHTTILARLIKCPACGRSLSANYRLKQKKPKHSYRCTSRTGATPCGNTQSFSMNLLDSAVWGLVKRDLPALSKIITQINPNIEIAELETHKNNVQNEVSTLENQIVRLKKDLKRSREIKNTDMTDDIDSIYKEIDKVGGRIDNLKNELALIESKLLLVNDEQLDIESVVMNNIDAIESSKELLKQYINYFIDSIEILNHSRENTILKVIFKEFTKPKFWEFVKSKDTLPDKRVEYLYIDKRVTRQIKLARMTHYPIDMFSDAHRQNLPMYLDNLKDFIDSNKHDQNQHVPYIKLNAK